MGIAGGLLGLKNWSDTILKKQELQDVKIIQKTEEEIGWAI